MLIWIFSNLSAILARFCIFLWDLAKLKKIFILCIYNHFDNWKSDGTIRNFRIVTPPCSAIVKSPLKRRHKKGFVVDSSDRVDPFSTDFVDLFSIDKYTIIRELLEKLKCNSYSTTSFAKRKNLLIP